MARETRRERIWERFAEQLANAIANKHITDLLNPLEGELRGKVNSFYVKYIKPHEKSMKKFPTGFFRKSNRFSIQSDAGYDAQCDLPEEILLPATRIMVGGEEFITYQKLQRLIYEIKGKQPQLYHDLFNNLVMAENFAEVVEKWPEAKELAEEVALTYTQSMNQPLSKILGKYTPEKMLPAPKK